MIRIVVAGTSSFGLPSFKELRQSNELELVGVISQPARPVGRHQVVTPTAVSAWAEEHGLPLLTPKNWKDISDLNHLAAWKPDLIVVAAYGVIVPATFLSIPRFGCLNIHASLLPAYRGAAPIAAAILNGDQTTGITFMQMDKGLDTGPILSQHETAIEPAETTITLTEKLSLLASQHIVDAVLAFTGQKLPAKAQPTTGTYAKKITREDGRADWTSAERLERQIRAYTPWPGVWTTWRGKTVKLLNGQTDLLASKEAPGTILGLSGGRWGICCQDGVFVPTDVQFEGKRPQSADLVPGSYPGWLGSRLGS